MGFRFRKSFSVAPGIRVNLGKRGASVTAGVPGAHVTVGKRGVSTSVGIPGTGISYTQHHGGGAVATTDDEEKAKAQVPEPIVAFCLGFAMIGLGAFVWLVAAGDMSNFGVQQSPAPFYLGGFGVAIIIIATILWQIDRASAARSARQLQQVVESVSVPPPLPISAPPRLAPKLPPEELNARLEAHLQKLQEEQDRLEQAKQIAAQRRELLNKTFVWYYFHDEVCGPTRIIDMLGMVQRGEIPANTQVCIVKTRVWQPLNEI